MAVTVVLCDRTEGKASKKHINNVDLKSKVRDFRAKASRILDLPVYAIDLIYCGQKFKDEQTLESYNLRAGSIVHVLKHNNSEQQDVCPEPMDSASVQQVVTALQAALMNPAHRNSVESMMSRPETIDNLVAATPGLDKDPVALAMLQDAELLAILADPTHIHKVIEAHPCLGHAAMMVAAAISEESSSSTGQTSTTGPSTYSLDQMSDDEEMGGMGHPPAQPITATQLAAALAAASGGGGSSEGSQSDPSSSSTSTSQPSSSVISADFFQQAMMQAAGSGTTNTQQSTVTDAALQQLRDMGITDESRARRALALTSGDIQAALELLFGDNDL